MFVSAQADIEKLAAQFMADGEFDKAVELYEDLVKRRPESVYLYDNYLKCLLQLEDYRSAEKLVKKQQRNFRGNMMYLVDEGYVLSFTEPKEAAKIFNALIQNHASTNESIRGLSNAFLKRDYPDRAIEVLEQGRKVLRSQQLFADDLLKLYTRTGRFSSLVSESLRQLNDGESNEEQTILCLEIAVDNGEAELVREKTLLYAQKYPENSRYDRILMWLFLQQKKYPAAIRQAKSLDRKEQAGGAVIIQLARQCASIGLWDVAANCYQEVVDMGPDKPYYSQAEGGLIQVRYAQIKNEYDVSDAKVDALLQAQTDYIESYGLNNLTALVAKQKGEILLFKKQNVSQAIETLESLVAVSGLDARMRDESKLMLGDAYLISGNVWDAQLTYSQVDKAFKEDPLGQEAKFRNARLSYFRSDFEWAKDQLEVLKTATTQLISNNAIELSLRIQDHTEMDTSFEALNDFASAELLLFQQKFDACLAELNRLSFKYTNHTLSDDIAYLKGKVYLETGDFQQALEAFKRVYSNYSSEILADNALYESAMLQLKHFHDSAKAKDLFEKIILDYPDSLFVVESRKQYEKLKLDTQP